MSAINVLTEPPYKESMFGRDGRLSPVWNNWFRQLWIRVGQEIALTNAQLEHREQEDIDEIQEDVDVLQSQMVAVQNTNTAQTNEINALKARVEAIELEPVA